MSFNSALYAIIYFQSIPIAEQITIVDFQKVDSPTAATDQSIHPTKPNL